VPVHLEDAFPPPNAATLVELHRSSRRIQLRLTKFVPNLPHIVTSDGGGRRNSSVSLLLHLALQRKCGCCTGNRQPSRMASVLQPFRRPNGSHTKLHGRGPRAEAFVARRLPRILLDSNA
jgi:hypothetical protein